MTVLSPAEAKQILDEMAATPPASCDQCSTPFTPTIKPERATFGPFPVWICEACKTRNASVQGTSPRPRS